MSLAICEFSGITILFHIFVKQKTLYKVRKSLVEWERLPSVWRNKIHKNVDFK